MLWGLKPSDIAGPFVNALIWLGGTVYAYLTWHSTQKAKSQETARLEAQRLEEAAAQAEKDRAASEAAALAAEAQEDSAQLKEANERAERWKADTSYWETKARQLEQIVSQLRLDEGAQKVLDARDRGLFALGLTAFATINCLKDRPDIVQMIKKHISAMN